MSSSRKVPSAFCAQCVRPFGQPACDLTQKGLPNSRCASGRSKRRGSLCTSESSKRTRPPLSSKADSSREQRCSRAAQSARRSGDRAPLLQARLSLAPTNKLPRMITGAHSIIYSKDPEADRNFFRAIFSLITIPSWPPAADGLDRLELSRFAHPDGERGSRIGVRFDVRRNQLQLLRSAFHCFGR
jgi:hypothetical protein